MNVWHLMIEGRSAPPHVLVFSAVGNGSDWKLLQKFALAWSSEVRFCQACLIHGISAIFSTTEFLEIPIRSN